MKTLFRALLAFAIGSIALEAKVQVESDFPGGSVVVDKLDEKARFLRFRPMNYKNKGWACWWSFKVSGLKPGEIWKLSLQGSGFAV
ncbi:MAG: zinc carboxypeptidase, partial [Opitutae bacterium]|nr:zinc carboxypeptidase [Opitutae bacterium]